MDKRKSSLLLNSNALRSYTWPLRRMVPRSSLLFPIPIPKLRPIIALHRPTLFLRYPSSSSAISDVFSTPETSVGMVMKHDYMYSVHYSDHSCYEEIGEFIEVLLLMRPDPAEQQLRAVGIKSFSARISEVD